MSSPMGDTRPIVYTVDESFIHHTPMRNEFSNGIMAAILIVVAVIAVLEAIAIGILIGAN